MKRRWIYLPLLLLVFLNHSTVAYETDWTEKKLGKVILKADKAARQKKWARAISYGEQMLQGVKALNQPDDARYIHQLKSLNRYYDKAKRLHEVPERVKECYILSKKHLGPNHETTRMSRTLYYKLLISSKNYNGAISLVLENISILKKGEKEDYRQHHYLKQLYSLYRMTGQLEKEEEALLRFLDLDKQIFNSSAKENIKIILNLANNYCRQKKLEKFNNLIKKYKFKYTC